LNKIGEPGVRRRAEFFDQQLDAVRGLRQASAAGSISREPATWRDEVNCAKIPYIGPIRAPLVIALIQTPHRFRTKRPLWT